MSKAALSSLAPADRQCKQFLNIQYSNQLFLMLDETLNCAVGLCILALKIACEGFFFRVNDQSELLITT